MSAGEPGLCRPTAPPSAHCPLPPPQGMDEVAASRTALQCLLESQDYAGSLELLGNLGHMVDRQLGLGIRAFKETRPQVGGGEGINEAWRAFIGIVNGPLIPDAGEIGRHVTRAWGPSLTYCFSLHLRHRTGGRDPRGGREPAGLRVPHLGQHAGGWWYPGGVSFATAHVLLVAPPIQSSAYVKL